VTRIISETILWTTGRLGLHRLVTINRTRGNKPVVGGVVWAAKLRDDMASRQRRPVSQRLAADCGDAQPEPKAVSQIGSASSMAQDCVCALVKQCYIKDAQLTRQSVDSQQG